MNLEKLEKYRKKHPAGWPHEKGDDFGWFEIPTKIGGPVICIQVSPGFMAKGWEHASVSLAMRCPTWEEMCMIKDLIWTEDQTVVQFHPPKSDYVNNHKYCLHLWRMNDVEFPRPEKWLV